MLHLILAIYYLVQYLLGYVIVFVTGLAFTAAFQGQTCSGHLAKVCGAPAFVTTVEHAIRTLTLLASTFSVCLTVKHRLTCTPLFPIALLGLLLSGLLMGAMAGEVQHEEVD